VAPDTGEAREASGTVVTYCAGQPEQKCGLRWFPKALLAGQPLGPHGDTVCIYIGIRARIVFPTARDDLHQGGGQIFREMSDGATSEMERHALCPERLPLRPALESGQVIRALLKLVLINGRLVFRMTTNALLCRAEFATPPVQRPGQWRP